MAADDESPLPIAARNAGRAHGMSAVSEEAVAGTLALPGKSLDDGSGAVRAGVRYRADIDGLRALAVLPVVLYHFRVPPFTGGYVGVDVFFVISGYLITSLIWGEIREGTFSILSFYERRVRRIFPALFALLAIVSLASAVILFPNALERYAISLLATAGFASNFHFWGDSGYWAAAAAEKPLLHTWSLAVEEQFYLFFPGFLLLLRRQTTTRVLLILGTTLAASLLLSIVGVFYWPITTFYLLPARFWELLIGSMLAIGAFPMPQSAGLRNALAALGLVLIGWGVFFLSSSSPFPGANAIPPCLGTALIIYAGAGRRETTINGLLSWQPLVFIGLISYSLYLWHWPIHVLLAQMLPQGLSTSQAALAIAASVALAALSWRYVEQPFRGRKSPIGRRPLFLMAGGAVAATVAVGIGIAAAGGIPQRYDAETRKIVSAIGEHEPLRAKCFNASPARVAAGKLCKFGAASAPPTFVLWGDSHADAMVPALLETARREGKAGFLAAHGHCAPLIGVNFPDRKCRPFNDAVAQFALRPSIQTVVLDAKWASPAGEPSLGRERTGWNTDDESEIAPGQGETRAVFARALDRTVKVLRAGGKRVIIVGPVPEYRRSVPGDLAKMHVWGGHWEIAPTRSDFLRREAYAYAVFTSAAEKYGAVIVRPELLLCAQPRCSPMKDGRPLYRDNTHLSIYGAEILAPLFTGLL